MKRQSHFISGNGFVSAEYEDGGWDRNRGYARGRGRGRGRGFRGRGRGGYNSPQVDAQQDMGGYNQEPPFQGRGNVSFNCFIYSSDFFCITLLFHLVALYIFSSETTTIQFHWFGQSGPCILGFMLGMGV